VSVAPDTQTRIADVREQMKLLSDYL